jgi:hypothetical protein
VAIGERLTKSGHAYLVQNYGGNLFVFALTEEQARHYGISGMQRGSLTTTVGESKHARRAAKFCCQSGNPLSITTSQDWTQAASASLTGNQVARVAGGAVEDPAGDRQAAA